MSKLYNAARSKFPIALNADASVIADEHGVDVRFGGDVERFDQVVLALQANDALRCVKDGLSPETRRFLTSFTYHANEIVAHTYYGVLPPYVKAWRTYNIVIPRNPAAAHPYTMTYVMNRHQNDARCATGGDLGTPQFFVTVNPPVPIPDSHVLAQPDGAPARTVFEDNNYDLTAIKAQETRANLQGINNLYLTGGYTSGAGLHEECWTDGMELAAQIKRDHMAGPARERRNTSGFAHRGAREAATAGGASPRWL